MVSETSELRRLLTATFMACLVMLFAGCGQSLSRPGVINIHLVDAPIAEYKEVNVDIQRVEIYESTAGWIVLGSPNRVINLLNLTGGVSETLVAGKKIPTGTYSQMRLVLGTANTVKLADGSVHPLVVHAGNPPHVMLTVDFTVSEGTTKDVVIDFDAAKSVQIHESGNMKNRQYVLRPTIRAMETVSTGCISGVLADRATGAALAGVVVMAEVFDQDGQAMLVRSTLSRTDGTYLLDLLPVDKTYYVVSQPVVGIAVYDAKISDPVTLTAETPGMRCDIAFTQAPMKCVLMGEVLPAAAANESDVVYLIQRIMTSEGEKPFIVRTEMPIFWGTLTERYLFTDVPAGDYRVQVTRTTAYEDGSVTMAQVMTVPDISARSVVTARDLEF